MCGPSLSMHKVVLRIMAQRCRHLHLAYHTHTVGKLTMSLQQTVSVQQCEQITVQQCKQITTSRQ